MIQDITIWLSGPMDYTEGLRLIERYSESRVLKMMLNAGETAFNRQKMAEALTELNQNSDTEVKVKEALSRQILTDRQYDEAPDAIKELKRKASLLFKENARRHAQLCQMVAEARRKHGSDIAQINAFLQERDAGAVANMILDCDDELAELFHKIDYWAQNKELPPDAPPVPEIIIADSMVDMIRHRDNLRCRISKAKKKKQEDKLRQLSAQLNAIEKKIDELT